MAAPYAPSQMNLSNFDASQAATATWLFSSPDPAAYLASFRIWIYNNTTGALILDTNWITSSTAKFLIPAGTLINRTQYKWQVKCTDNAGNISPVSQFQVFTCSSAPVVTLLSPTPQQLVTANTLTLSAAYAQVQGVLQQTYRIVLYAADQTTILQDSGIQYGALNQLAATGLTSGNYFAEAIVTSADGLQASTGKIPFSVAYSGSAQSPSIQITPLPDAAALRIDWHNPKSIPGVYQGPGATYGPLVSKVFSDPLTSGAMWTIESGSFVFGSGGATSSANGSVIASKKGTGYKPTTDPNQPMTAEASFTAPKSGSMLSLVQLRIDQNNMYLAQLGNNGTLLSISKVINGTRTSLGSTTVTPAVAAGSSYTITLQLDCVGNLTACLYSGARRSGGLLKSMNATNAELAGPFTMSFKADSGVTIFDASISTYISSPIGQGIRVGMPGEKVYWQVAALTQFTYTSWWSPLSDASLMASGRVITRLQADSANFIQARYDPVSTAFVLDVCKSGEVTTRKSAAGVTFVAGQQLFVAIRQTATALTVIFGAAGQVYNVTLTNASAQISPYGTSQYGLAKYTSAVSGIVQNIKTIYIGCSPADGEEANALFSQTHMTSNTLSDSDIYSIYLNSARQQFGLTSLFLANFDGSMEGGDASGTPIISWDVVRVAGGVPKVVGTVANVQQATATFTDTTPLSGVSYLYNVVPKGASGNPGAPQSASGSVNFDGWWLNDPITGAFFHIVVEVEDVPLETVDGRSETVTYGQFPVVSYTSTEYRKGSITGMLVAGYKTSLSPHDQYQAFHTLISSRRPLLLRGEEGDGMMVDCHNRRKTITKRGHGMVNKIEFEWTEVANLT